MVGIRCPLCRTQVLAQAIGEPIGMRILISTGIPTLVPGSIRIPSPGEYQMTFREFHHRRQPIRPPPHLFHSLSGDPKGGSSHIRSELATQTGTMSRGTSYTVMDNSLLALNVFVYEAEHLRNTFSQRPVDWLVPVMGSTCLCVGPSSGKSSLGLNKVLRRLLYWPRACAKS